MDRNNDGDLIWNEFLGHVELFHELDADHDELLDPQEAAKATASGESKVQTTSVRE